MRFMQNGSVRPSETGCSVWFLLCCWFLVWFPVTAHATAQIPDEIVIDGESHPLFTEPLASMMSESDLMAVLEKHGLGMCTANWRGYMAEWRIHKQRLELVKFIVGPCHEDRHEIPLDMLFPDQVGPIAASRYSGKLLVPLGNQVEYVHGGYGSKYERYLQLTIENGIVIDRVESTERPD